MSKEPTEQTPRSSSAIQTVLLLVLAAGALFAISRYVLRRNSRDVGVENPAVGADAPDVSFSSLTEDKVTKLIDQRGKVVLINFWGTWCPPCRAEFPALVELTKPNLSRDDFFLISVCVPGGSESKEELALEAKKFLLQQRAEFAAYHDPNSEAFDALLKAAGVQQGGIPFTVIIDRQGKFAGVWMGYDVGDEDEVAKVLDTAIQNKAKS